MDRINPVTGCYFDEDDWDNELRDFVPQLQMVPIREAAASLNVSIDTIRRRIKSRTIEAERRPHGGGFKWFVGIPQEIHEHRQAVSEVESLRQEVAELRRRLAWAESDRSRLIDLLHRQSRCRR